VSAEDSFLDVTIYGREHRVACPAGEREALEAAVGFVDRRMNDIATKTKNATPERVAVMAALNIAHEFLSYRESHQEGFDTALAKRRIIGMEARLDALLVGAKPAEGSTTS
jgi:cell division protein ZapA